MNRAAHKITRVVFEIGLRGRERVTTIQNRVSAFAGGTLETVLIQWLSAPTDENQLLALDVIELNVIELNVGNVSYQHLEEDLAAGIARCLREWALRSLPPHRLQSLEPARGSSESGGASEPGVHLLPGPAASLSSFSISASRGGLNAAVASALQGPGDWPQLMAAVRDNHAFRCRLANEVSPKLLGDLLRSLVPADGARMTEISGVLASLHHCVSPASAGCHAFRRVLWECILSEVGRYQPTTFSLRSFLANVLASLAARYSLERSVLFSRIAQSLGQRAQAAQPRTPVISRELRQALFNCVEAPEPLRQSAAGPLAQETTTAPLSRPIDDLGRFLECGVLPWSAQSGSSRDIDSDMLKLLAAWPDAVCSLVRRLGEMQPVRKRIAGQLSEKAVHRLIGALDPVNAPWMFLCQQSLRRLHAQRPLVPMQNRVFAQLLQELTLEYLEERHWHALGACSFMRFLLRGLAARQKTEYELLLADVALRHSPKSRDTGAQSLVNSAIVTLLEEDVLGVRGRLLDAPRFVVRPAFQHLYCDLDVLAYWLRWRKLPAWSFAATPEEMAARIGPLLRDLPPQVRASAERPRAEAATMNAGIVKASASALQIEYWLLYGMWPAGVSLPQNSTLVEWLEGQSDSDWLEALRRCGSQDTAVQRIVNHLSPAFLLRIASLLAGSRAQGVCGLFGSLQDLKPHIGVTNSLHWEEQVRRYTLTYLLQHVSSDGQAVSCTEELAQNTLQALALRCQVSYERLLLLLRQESQENGELLDLCLKLEAKLDHPSVRTVLIAPESPARDVAHSPDLVLHYLKHGSLPESASGLSFHALRQLAGRLTQDQLAAVAHEALPEFADGREIARRTAVLLPVPAFARLAALLLPGMRFTEEIEGTLSVLAARLSLQPAALLIAARTFLLQHAACHAGNFNKELAISGMLGKLVEYTGESQPLLVDKLLHATGGKGALAEALASLPREVRFTRTEPHQPAIAAMSTQPSAEPGTGGNASQQLERLLHSGRLPATAASLAQIMQEFSEGLVQRPREYASVLLAAAAHAPERRRMARVFSDSLYRRVCRLLFSATDFADKLEYALRVLAPHFHADSGLLVTAGREELLKYAATREDRRSVDGMEREVLKALCASLEKRIGVGSVEWLEHLAGVLGVNFSSSPAAGGEKERTRLALEVAGPELCRPPRDMNAELAATEQSKNKNGPEDQEQGELQALAHLLRTGHMPWWGHTLLPLSSGRFQSLLESKPDPVLQILRSAANSPRAMDRVMRYLPRPDLSAIILKAVPRYGGILILYITAGAELAEDRGLSATQRSRAPGLHWRETLSFVLQGESSSGLPANALRALCGRVAEQLGLAGSLYLEKMARIARRHAPAESGCAALAEMLRQMRTSVSSEGEKERHSPEPVSQAQRPAPEATGSTTCDTEASLSTPDDEHIEETGPAETLAFPNEAVQTGQLEYLLRYGVLPQATPAKSLPQFMNDLAQAFSTHPEQYRKQMQKAAGRSLERQRIARLFSTQALSRLWPLLLPHDHEQAVLCLDALSAGAVSCSGGGVSESLRMTCAEELLHTASRAEGTRWEIAAFLRHAVRRLEEDHSLHPAEVIEHLRKELAGQRRDVQAKLGPALDRVERETAVVPIRPIRKSATPTLESRRTPQAQKTPTPLPAGEAFYIGNAGAILVWPFLSRYFQMLALIENNSFRGEEERSRAIHLVQYLATGKLEAPEHELLLNKLLCGARPEQPLEPVTPVTEAEEVLSQQLLNSVIRTWDKMRNTSIEGLRQSFLVREGQLLRRDSDDSWSLAVSARSYDMLLDSLPWRLSLVRLPWMQAALHVKWR